MSKLTTRHVYATGKRYSPRCAWSQIQATDSSPRLIDLLIRWGASVDSAQSRVTFPLEDGHKKFTTTLLSLVQFSTPPVTGHDA